RLVVGAPTAPEQIQSSWLAEWLPVRIVGHRLARGIQTTDGRSFDFIELTPLTEAAPGDGVIALRDENYVHAAYRTVGSGRIIFTSFGVSALPEEAARPLWKELMAFEQLPVKWDETAIDQSRDAMLSSMIGKQVAPWSAAAAMVAVYVGI